MGTIPDGKYSTVGKALTLLSGPRSSRETMQRLAAILEQAQSEPPQSETVLQQIAEVPGLGDAVLRLLPENKEQWYSFIAMLLAVIAFLFATQQQEPLNEDQVTRAVQRGVEAAQRSLVERDEPYAERPSRNQPCSCGSEKKYKHCCGRDDPSPSDRLLRDLQDDRKNPDYGTGGYRT
ncbi:SEC-C metal-binding domain-containing protein [Alcaligenes sp. DN25]|uniref:SEC-C metal-binding domain-containing protein n=1 Tax=Alcaligenes TaxID=507 RepID=UPI00202E8864|nr:MULTISPECIES: SEC-C metal-binding domain-containing protein [Alcaligenes]URW83881.1 SEC-C metal-binding domain-containing protein [Alcaligenes sp. DN25]WEA68719.1 SEC-C metal-binding domain-containing protein [Alcaligenes faecalis]